MDNRSLSHTRWKCQYHIVFIPKYRKRFVAQILVDIKKEQDELKDILGSEYQDYNLVMATTFGLPIEDSYLRDQMQKVIDEQGLPDVDLLMKVLGNPEMAALLTSLAKSLKAE